MSEQKKSKGLKNFLKKQAGKKKETDKPQVNDESPIAVDEEKKTEIVENQNNEKEKPKTNVENNDSDEDEENENEQNLIQGVKFREIGEIENQQKAEQLKEVGLQNFYAKTEQDHPELKTEEPKKDASKAFNFSKGKPTFRKGNRGNEYSQGLDDLHDETDDKGQAKDKAKDTTESAAPNNAKEGFFYSQPKPGGFRKERNDEDKREEPRRPQKFMNSRKQQSGDNNQDQPSGPSYDFKGVVFRRSPPTDGSQNAKPIDGEEVDEKKEEDKEGSEPQQQQRNNNYRKDNRRFNRDKGQNFQIGAKNDDADENDGFNVVMARRKPKQKQVNSSDSESEGERPQFNRGGRGGFRGRGGGRGGFFKNSKRDAVAADIDKKE